MRISALPLVLALLPLPAAAEADATCAGVIDALPAVITTQGTWCLDHDLSTAMVTGTAVLIGTNNVTLDCNGFKIGGNAAGPGTTAIGVLASGRSSVAVRNCTVRGFDFGILLDSGDGGGNLVRSNLVEGSINIGLWVSGDGSVIVDNQVLRTGVGAGANAYGIYTVGAVDIIGNSVTDVFPNQSVAAAGFGIFAADNPSGRVSGNVVRGVREGTGGPAPGGAAAIGIGAGSTNVAVEDNSLFYIGGDSFSLGLRCYGEPPNPVAAGNDLLGFAYPLDGCRDGGGNEVH